MKMKMKIFKDSKKMIVIAVCAILVLGCAGAVAAKLLRSESKPVEKQQEKEKEEKKEKVEKKTVTEFDNEVERQKTTVNKVLYENDFSKTLDPYVDDEWDKSSFFGCTAELTEDGWLHITSTDHIFVFGQHTWGMYGGISFETGKTYTMSFDLKKGKENANNVFTLNLAEEVEGQDPRYGNQLKQLVLDFSDIENFVAFNSDKGSFGAVTYKDGVAHIEIRFTKDRGSNNYLVNSRDSTLLNDWLIDNMYIAEITEENSDFQWLVEDTQPTYDFSLNTKRSSYTARRVLLDENFDTEASLVLEKSLMMETGGASVFFGPTKMVWDNKAARLTTGQHLFTFGRFAAWGRYFGGIEFLSDHQYVMSFDMKLGDARTQKVFNLYLMQEDDPDPRFGTALKTLTLDFNDLYQKKQSGDSTYFVKENTDNWASVVYNSKTRTAHVEIRFSRNVEPDIQVVSKGTGDNEWVFDNFYVADITPSVNVSKCNYSNGVDFSAYRARLTVFTNDFSTSVDAGVTQSWQKSAYFDSKAELLDGMAHLTSSEHLFVYGMHTWGQYGGVRFEKGSTYKMSFDLKLGDNDANRTFNLYTMTENGDPRFGNVQKTLTLNFMDYQNLVTTNTDNFASVNYNKDTDVAHIEILFTADTVRDTCVVSKSRGENNWLIDNVVVEEVVYVCDVHVDDNGDGVCDRCGQQIVAEKDYSNGISFENYSTVSTLFENDFSEDANKGVTAAWHKSAFFDSTATLEDGWARVTSSEHVFVFGGHSWGLYGGIAMSKNTLYRASFDLKLGDDLATHTFNFYVMNENNPDSQDPRFGTAAYTLTLNFADFTNFVTQNTNNFASVTYNAATHTAHVEAIFKTDAEVNTQLVARNKDVNNWYLDNLKIDQVKYVCQNHVDLDSDGKCDVCGEAVIVEKDYDNGVDLSKYAVSGVTFENDFSEDANKGVTAAWHKSAFFDSTATLEDGWVRITSNEHAFVYGMHAWGQYGGVKLDMNQLYKTTFDLKLGEESANKTFTLYVTTENGDPRYGTVSKELTLNFENFDNFVTVNTDNFAKVTYSKATHTAHIEVVYTTDSSKNTLLVSRCSGTNNWLLDNMKFEEVVEEKDYDNGVDLSKYKTKNVVFENDFSENADKGVTAAWHKSAFFDSTATLEDGWARVTSSEHVFVFGGHNWGLYGGFGLSKDQLYKVSFDLKLGAEDANKEFQLYVMTENGDPRFGDVVKTLTLNFADIANFVKTNTDNFASVTYTGQTKTAHVEMVFQTDQSKNTQVVSKCSGTNNWLLDNLKFEKVTAP